MHDVLHFVTPPQSIQNLYSLDLSGGPELANSAGALYPHGNFERSNFHQKNLMASRVLQHDTKMKPPATNSYAPHDELRGRNVGILNSFSVK